MLEYYCWACAQLRLYAKDEGRPERCSNCGSDRIKVDEVGSKVLAAIRFEGREPDAEFSVVIFPEPKN